MANLWLNWVRGSSTTPPTTVYAQLHVGVPGATAASNLSAGTVGGTVRVAITFAAASGGSISITGTAPSWTCSASAVSETLSHVSFFDASSGGNCLWTAALNSTRTWSTGDTYTLSTDSLNLTPLAAN
ncbi:hypothetical protein GS4_39_00520 [Gordonia soli NBRC 108243]|uniref:Uncharacterized protein n=2 Tax=Gordonia soli TaxID=320799 RepID=M0QR22_9ACTN|nr:hypothetical protein GS4_39_00520 [Gordonia soli NBRC 108243]